MYQNVAQSANAKLFSEFFIVYTIAMLAMKEL